MFANWVVKVYKVCPGVGYQAVFQIARYYMIAAHLGISTEKLDLFIAHKPWVTLWDLLGYVNGIYHQKSSAFSIPGAHLRILLSAAESLYDRETRETGVDDGQGLNILNENFARLVGTEIKAAAELTVNPLAVVVVLEVDQLAIRAGHDILGGESARLVEWPVMNQIGAENSSGG